MPDPDALIGTPDDAVSVRAQPLALAYARARLRATGLVSESLAVRFARRLFLTTRRHPTPEWERELTGRGRSVSIPMEEGPLAGWIFGEEGPLVLLVHGWDGRGTQLGMFVEPLLRSGHRVATFDHVGHGASPGKLSSLPQFRQGIDAATAVLGTPCAVIAHSIGGVATALSLDGNQALKRAVFIATPLDVRVYADALMRLLGGSEALYARLLRDLEQRFEIEFEHATMLYLAPRMTTPLLVVHDWEDRDVPLDDGVELARLWPEARLVETTGHGHRRILRAPEVVEEVVRFVRRK